jgi:GH25 family lysozyme M1 (1,4-beta-N-acetylmuramidase)
MSETNENAKNKKRRSYKGLAILELIVIIGLSGALSWKLLKNDSGSKEAVPANAQVQDGDPEVRTRAVIEKEETFYQLDGKKILFKDSSLGEVFVPVFADVPASSLKTENIVTRNGYSFYRGSSDKVFTGIDISEHQSTIDWNKVKSAGVDFAIIRVGYRTYGGGKIQLDEHFAKNIQEANAAGIDVGVYFFSQAVSTEEAVEEADAVIDAIAPYNITYPVIFDWEIIYGDPARTDSMTVECLADCCISFCERVRSAGYTPMIYQNKNTAMMKLDLPRLKDYDFWLAEYASKPSYYYDYQIWQYTSDGYIPGVEGSVDINLCFKDYSHKSSVPEDAPQE